jgi:predicted O-methyltransferase YrrM
MRELENDVVLRHHIQKIIETSDEGRFADPDVKYGKRLGWYAIVRATKPQTVVETGVDKGLGSCVLTAALQRNEQEGHPGYYYGTDINPMAGYLLQGDYARHGEILYGDSIESLKQMTTMINVFINDSDHSSEYEAREYETVKHKLTENAIVIGDNAHVTDELITFAERTDREFLFLRRSRTTIGTLVEV